MISRICVADAAAVNPTGTKILLANGFSTFSIKDKSVFNNAPRSLPKNSPDCPILYNWVFDNFISANELLENVLGNLETYLLIKNDLCGNLISSLELPITFDERFKVTLVLFFIPDFNLLSCELDKFTDKVLYWVILYWYYIERK